MSKLEKSKPNLTMENITNNHFSHSYSIKYKFGTKAKFYSADGVGVAGEE